MTGVMLVAAMATNKEGEGWERREKNSRGGGELIFSPTLTSDFLLFNAWNPSLFIKGRR